MLPYLIVLTFIVFWIGLEQKALNRKSFWLPLMVLALFSGVRSFRVGTDSGSYTRKFTNSSLDLDYFSFEKGVEFGYQLFEYGLLHLTTNYFWLFFLTGLIVVYCYLHIIKIYSVNYWYSVFLFITLGTYTFFFNGLRQGLAMAVFVLSLPYLFEKRLIIYILICLFASLFHVTALIMIPFYFLVNIRVKVFYKILISFTISLLASKFFITYASVSNERYETYGEISEESGGLLTLGFHVTLTFIIYIVSYIYKIKNEDFTKLYTFYATGVVFIIPIAMLGTMASGPQRILYYFTWSLILLLPAVIVRINNKFIYIMSLGLSLVFFILTTTKFSNLTPYLINPIFNFF